MEAYRRRGSCFTTSRTSMKPKQTTQFKSNVQGKRNIRRNGNEFSSVRAPVRFSNISQVGRVIMAKGPDGTLGFHSRRIKLNPNAKEYIPVF